jgi:hypothetical protein
MIKRKVDQGLETKIHNNFLDDIEKLEDLLDVNLDFWKHS